MSYGKVSGGNRVFSHIDEITEDSPPPDVHLYELPKTFIMCPACRSTDLHSVCNCYPKNYTCGKCGWRYLTHDPKHRPVKSGVPSTYNPASGTGGLTNQSILSKALRR